MKRLNKIFYWAACFILTSGIATYAAETAQVTVPYGDLNLSQEEGATALLSRIDHAATHVCGGRPQIADLHAWSAYEACRKDSMDRAVATVKAPLVASLYGLPHQHATMIAQR